MLKGTLSRRLFIFCLLYCTWPAAAQATTAAPACAPGKQTVVVAVRHVIDGDTVVLAGGEKLRLIGIDTPEISQRERPAQPGATAARAFLDSLLHGGEVRLLAGREKRDHHGRLLGHLFLADGSNVQASLLAAGQARPLNIPPNLVLASCYNHVARQAIQLGQGIWALPQYQPRPANSLQPADRGYRIVRGRVTRIGHSASSLWLNLSTHLAVRIHRDDLAYFDEIDLNSLRGRGIQVRGTLYSRKRQLRMRIRYHADLTVL